MTEADRLEQHLAEREAARPIFIDGRIHSLEYEVRQLDAMTYEATVGRRALTTEQRDRIAAAIEKLQEIQNGADDAQQDRRAAA